MKMMNDFIKIVLWIGGLALLRFFVEYWITTQNYTLYSTLTGLFFFILVAYVSYRELKI